MKFLKSNILFIIAIAILAAIVFIPGLKLKIKDLFFPVAEIENAVMIPEKDFDISLKGINTSSTNLKNLKNEKLIFLNFWGTWCPPCREEWPSIQKLYDNENTNIHFVLIAMQDQEQDVKDFLSKNKYTVPVYIAQSPITDKLLPNVFPTTYLLNKDGRILLKETSAKDWSSQSVLQFIQTVKH